MNILITGGCGFIGSNLVRYILENTEHRVFNIDKLTYAGTERNHKDYLYNPNYFFEKTDIKDMEKVDKIFHSFKPDAVMHLAAESHVDRSIDSSNEFIGTNIIGTHILLEVARNYCDISETRKKSFKFLYTKNDTENNRAGKIKFLFLGLVPFSLQFPENGKNDDQADRHINEEDASPSKVVGQKSAQKRPQREPQIDCHHIYS